MELNVDLGLGGRLVFGTPILVRKLQDPEPLNSGLRTAVLQAESEDRGRKISNVGGWQSAPTLLNWSIPEIRTIRAMVEEAAVYLSSLPFQRPVTLEYTAQGWANVSRNGDYNLSHLHAREHWAVVYYVACGEPDANRAMNGELELRDPRPGAHFVRARYLGFTFGQGLVIKPEPGLLVAFPGWMEHFVHAFFGRGERISLAINVQVKAVHPRDGEPLTTSG